MTQSPNIKTLLHTAKEALHKKHYLPLDAEVLLAHTLQCERAYLFTYPEKNVNPSDCRQFTALLERRLNGEPVAYIIGRKSFYGLDFIVNPAVLVPRPETEDLVEKVLERLKAKRDEHKTLLDLGTGSGCIAIALAKALTQWHVTAIDASSAALATAKQNATNHACNNMTFIESNWFAEISKQRFSVIVSNPPYIAADDSELEQQVKDYEPHLALIAKHNGLAAYQDIIKKAPQYLHPNGLIAFEIGYRQADQVAQLLSAAKFHNIAIEKDLQGLARYIFAHNAKA